MMPEIPIIPFARDNKLPKGLLRICMRTFLRARDALLAGSHSGPDFILRHVGLHKDHENKKIYVELALRPPGVTPIVLRLPYDQIYAQDEQTMAWLCDIASLVIERYLAPPDEEFERQVIERNDAICAAIAETARTPLSSVSLNLPSPFNKAMGVVQRTSETALWTLQDEHQQWFLAHHVELGCVPHTDEGTVLSLTPLMHASPTATDPLAVMRLLSHLPAASPILIPQNAWIRNVQADPF